MKTEYEVFESNIAQLGLIVSKINKRAEKAGYTGIAVTYGDTFLVDYKDSYGNKLKAKKVTVTVEYEDLSLSGWSLVGVLDHTLSNDAAIVRAVPGQQVPKQYFHADHTHCDHCNTRRVRNETFIVSHESEGYKQIGRNCLIDFLGTDPSRKLWLLSQVQLLDSMLTDSEHEGWTGGREIPYVEVENLLKATLAWTSKHGYVSTKVEEGISTKSTMIDYFFGHSKYDDNGYAKYLKELRQEVNNLLENGGFSEEYDAMIKWVEGKGVSESFWHSVSNLIDIGAVSSRYFGYLVCIPALFRKERGETTSHPINEEYVGTVGVRGVFPGLIVTRVHHYTNFYGDKTIVVFHDPENHLFTWFASGIVEDYEEGSTVTVKATVKDHTEYKGHKQTILTRVAKQK